MAEVRRALIAAVAALAAGAAIAAADPAAPQAPRLEFEPPAPGSYQLQHIQPAPDALLFDADSRVRSLAALTRGKVTLLSFFYTYCSDAWGCPYAYTTLTGLRERLLAEPALARQVRFVNISFDPANDTPAALRLYGAGLADDPRFEWRFLTAPSLQRLLPLLGAYGQDVSIATDARGRPTRTRYHMLKMFLIDTHGEVREIYALDYLHPQVMLGDIRTLLMEGR